MKTGKMHVCKFVVNFNESISKLAYTIGCKQDKYRNIFLNWKSIDNLTKKVQ